MWKKSSFCNADGCVEVNVFKKSSFCSSDGCVEVGMFKKSSFCQSDGCVEVGAGAYQKSSFCNSDGCVEAMVWAEGVLVRDTKFATREEESPVLAFIPEAWDRFLGRIKGGAVLSALTYEPGDVVIWVGQLNGTYFMSRAGDPTTLEFDEIEWRDFVKGINNGEFDLSDELALAI